MATIPERRKSAPREPRESKGSWTTEEHTVFDGRVKVYRCNQSGLIWQMRVWFHENQKYFRQSLRTPILQEALTKAEDIYLDLRAKVKSGERIFQHTAKELVDKYIDHRGTEIRTDEREGSITNDRWVTIRSQMKHYLGFTGDNVKVDAIPNYKFQDYVDYRRTYAPKVKQVTLANEISTIKNFYQWGIDRHLISSSSMPLFPKISKRNNDEKSSRDELTIEEWRTIYKYMEHWHKGCGPVEAEEKQFIRHFALLLANTGLRFGEAYQLKWENVKILEEGKSVDVRIDLKKGKTGKRTIIGRRGDILKRLKRISKYTKPSDWVFVNNRTGEPIVKDTYYKYWNQMIKDTGLDKTSSKQYCFYALRHTYATWRLYSGVHVFTLAKNMGCSVKFIEDHYGHVDVTKQRDMLTKGIDKDVMSFLVD